MTTNDRFSRSHGDPTPVPPCISRVAASLRETR